jgi:hypothetical protein
MCKEIPVIPVIKVVDKKRITGKGCPRRKYIIIRAKTSRLLTRKRHQN